MSWPACFCRCRCRAWHLMRLRRMTKLSARRHKELHVCRHVMASKLRAMLPLNLALRMVNFLHLLLGKQRRAMLREAGALLPVSPVLCVPTVGLRLHFHIHQS